MELNLRKARKLESDIQSHLESTRPGNATAAVRVLGTLDDAKANLEKSRQELLAKLPVREQLIEVRYGIRRQIEEANEKLGINALINQKVLLDSKSKDVSMYPTACGPNGLELEDTFNHQVAMYNAPTDTYSRNKSISFALNSLKEEDVAAFAAQKLKFKKQIQAIEDTLGEKNIIGKVKLSEDAVKLLESSGLI